MSYILGGITLPQPKQMTINIIELAQEHLIMGGVTTKRTQKRKYQYVLEYTFLTEAQLATLESLYFPGSALSFQVTEANRIVNPVDVLVDVDRRQYNPVGHGYRENTKLILTEVVGSS